MTPTPVGMRCPECARQRTKVRTAQTLGGDPTVTYVLIAINVLVALGVSFGGGSTLGGGVLGSEIGRQGALYGPAVAAGDYWRLVTSGFLHAGLIHLLFNMYALYILGSLLEPAVGRVRFLLIYFVSLLAGSFGALLLTPNSPTVGASGAVFGLMSAAILVMRHRGIDPMASGLPIWLGLNLLLTFTIGGLSVGGHIGGIVGGALAAIVLFELPKRVRLPRIGAEVIAGALGAAAIAGSIAVVG
jgi:membrane associated rhomboid family serine protease